MRIDSHQHFWRYDPKQHSWMTDAMNVLRRDYLPEELEPLLRLLGFDGTVAVQARQIVEESDWLLDLSDRYSFIKGVVGWVDLRSPQVREQLERLARHPRFIGVRHIVHDEPDDQFLLRPDFRAGLAQLRDFNLVYDLLLFPRHLPVAIQLMEAFPQQTFVLDHIGKPGIATGQISPWKEDLRRLAEHPNVFCKLSGMVTEAKWKQWEAKDFYPYLDNVMEAFGPQRVMIGSDWPVCTLSGAYRPVMNIVIDYARQFSAREQDAIFGGNCARIYRLG